MALPTSIQAFIERQADQRRGQYSDLRAVIFNGTLKRSPEPSNTDGLLEIVRTIFSRVGVSVAEVRTVDHEIPPGLWPDMREHGYEDDDFPAIYRESVAPADMILITGPIWLGDQSSQTRKIIERLYATQMRSTTAASGPTTERLAAFSPPETRMGVSTPTLRSSTGCST